MSWGFTLIAAANLHLMLGFNNCTYYEQAVPYESYEYGMKDVIRTQPMVMSTRRKARGWAWKSTGTPCRRQPSS